MIFSRCFSFLTLELKRVGESEQMCGAGDKDTNGHDVGNIASHVDVLCQFSNFDSDLHQNDSSQFDQLF